MVTVATSLISVVTVMDVSEDTTSTLVVVVRSTLLQSGVSVIVAGPRPGDALEPSGVTNPDESQVTIESDEVVSLSDVLVSSDEDPVEDVSFSVLIV
jgi:hypothetical protein